LSSITERECFINWRVSSLSTAWHRNRKNRTKENKKKRDR